MLLLFEGVVPGSTLSFWVGYWWHLSEDSPWPSLTTMLDLEVVF